MALTFLLNDLDTGTDDWEAHKTSALRSLARTLEAFPGGPVEYQAEEDNRGLGADWTVIALTILSLVGSGFFAIPSAHKKIRETLEEWRRVRDSLNVLGKWLAEHHQMLAYPQQILFLDALSEIEKSADVDEAVLIDASEVIVLDDDHRGAKPLAQSHFTFVLDGMLYVYAYDKHRRLLWSRLIELESVKP